MKTKRKLLLLTLIIITGSFTLSGVNMKKLSSKIMQMQTSAVFDPYDKGSINFLRNYHELRVRTKVFQELDINTQSDTIYIIQNQSDGTYVDLMMTVWNSRKTISYKQKSKWDSLGNFKGLQIEKYDIRLFIKYMIELVSEWRRRELIYESVTHGTTGPNYIVTRIIFKANTYMISCIEIRDFFELKRDDVPDNWTGKIPPIQRWILKKRR